MQSIEESTKKMKKSKYLETAIKAAKEASKISLKYFNKKKKISYKKGNEIVTNADKESELKIIKIILSKFPEHNIWGEEGGESTKKSEYRWVIDPIDGTFVYSRGIETFGISIALEHKGAPIVGVNYFPVLKKLYYAEKGKGAYLNDKKIHVSKKSDVKPLYMINSEMTRYPELTKKFTKRLIAKELSVKDFGSTALHLSMVADGKADAAFSYGIKPGDISAGIIIVREAGGNIINLKGKKGKSSDKKIISYSAIVNKKDLI